MIVILTVMFGYLGIYRFYKGQFRLGLVYLFTYGFFGIGWIVDIFLAVREYKENKNNFKNPEGGQDDELQQLEYELKKEKLTKELSEMKNQSAVCEYCGSKISGNDYVCPKCGAPK